LQSKKEKLRNGKRKQSFQPEEVDLEKQGGGITPLRAHEKRGAVKDGTATKGIGLMSIWGKRKPSPLCHPAKKGH